MLVLTRKKHQSIIIGNDIEILVLEVTGDKVRLGIQAPRDVSVFRKEVLIAIGLDGDGNLAIEDVTKTDFEAA